MVADLQIEAEEANGGVLLTVVDSARLTMLLTRETAAELLDAIVLREGTPSFRTVYPHAKRWRKRDGEISDPWANDEADGYQPPSYEPVNPERRTAQTPSDGLI